MADLSNLIERLERATAGDRELDAELEAALRDETQGYRYPAKFTTSVDFALALIARMLPEERLWLQNLEQSTDWMMTIGERDSVFAPTPALALCLALTRAVRGNEDG